MPRLIAGLIRHGSYYQSSDTPSAHQPFSLTPRGEEQAISAAHDLNAICRERNWSLASEIDSSRLLRAWQTAEIIRAYLQVENASSLLVNTYDELAERSMGSAANLTIQQIEDVLESDPRYPAPPENWKSNSYYQLPLQGAESLVQAGLRVAEHLNSQMRKLGETATVDTLKIFVGHGAAFRHAAWHLRVLTQEQVAMLSMHHCKPVFFEYKYDDDWLHIAGNWKQRKISDEDVD